MLALFDSIRWRNRQPCMRDDFHEINSRIVHRERRVPKSRSDRDKSFRFSLQIEKFAADSNALRCFAIAVLKARENENFQKFQGIHRLTIVTVFVFFPSASTSLSALIIIALSLLTRFTTDSSDFFSEYETEELFSRRANE